MSTSEVSAKPHIRDFSAKDNLLTVAVFFIALALLWAFHPVRDFAGMEIRFAYFAQEMLRSGITLFPHTQLGPYPDYPVASTLVIYALALIADDFNLYIAVLPSALTSAATIATVWRIGALHSRELGFVAATLLVCTFEFLIQARMVSLDCWVMLFTTLGFYIAISATLRDNPLPLVQLLLMVFLATAFRGAIGGVIVTGVISGVCLVNQRWKDLLVHGCLAALVIAVTFALLMGAAYLEGGPAFLERMLEFQVGNRFELKRSPLDIYVISAMGAYAITYPLAALTLICILLRGKPALNTQTILLLAIAVWMIVVIAGLSIPGTKKTRYILPAAPAMALLAAALLVPVGEYLFPQARRFALGLLTALPLLLCLTALVLLTSKQADQLCLYSNLWWTAGVTALLGITSVYCNRKLQGNPQLYSIVILCALSFMTIKTLVQEPGQSRHDSDRPFVGAVEQYRQTLPESQLAFYAMYPEYEDMNYLVVLHSSERPLYFNSAPELDAYQGSPLILIMRRDQFDGFRSDYQGHWQQVAEGDLAHKDCVAVILTSAAEGG